MGQNWSIIVPEATVNLCTNPSFELATTGWVASGTNTIARSAAQQFAGVYSLLITYGNNTTLATFTPSGLSAATTYTITARIYVPADWNGGDIRLNASGFTSATVTQVREWDDVAGERGKWVELELRVALSADNTGTILLQTTSPATAGRTVYLDAVQIEAKAYPTTYCDGDQQGCTWSGLPHASTSSRDEFEASGGRLRNLDADFGFLTGADEGTGVFPLQMLFHPQPLLPGDNFQGINVQSRSNLLLRGGFEGETTPDLHAKRQALAKALNSRVGRIDQKPQPRQLYYHGAAVEKRIGVYYVAGLGVKDRIGTVGERIDGLQFYAPDPAWYDVGERAAVLGATATANFRTVARQAADGTWDDMGYPAVSGDLDPRGFAEDDTYIYIFGSFLNFAGIANADFLVRRNKQTGVYSDMGAANAIVRTMAVAANGDVYAGGDFTSIGGVSANRIAKWNGSSWSALGTGLNGICYKILPAPDGGIYVCGDFTTAGGSSRNYIAHYDGSSWNALGSGMNASTRDLAMNSDNVLYAVGQFTSAGGVSVGRVAQWDGTSWSDMNGGFPSTVQSVVVARNNDVYVGGFFTATTSGTPANRVARWNGAQWSALGDGVSPGAVYTVFLDPTGNILVSGSITSAGGILVDRIAAWNGSEWYRLDIDLPGSSAIVYGYASSSGDLFFAFNDSGAAVYSVPASVLYEGTEQAYPVIEIARSGGTAARIQQLKSVTTRATLYMDYALLDGEKLTIDLRPSNFSVVSSFYGPVPRAILPNSSVANFYLSPGNQSGGQINLISCFVYGAGSPTVTAVMRWRDTYSSYD